MTALETSGPGDHTKFEDNVTVDENSVTKSDHRMRAESRPLIARDTDALTDFITIRPGSHILIY
jgi:hypothetical protein